MSSLGQGPTVLLNGFMSEMFESVVLSHTKTNINITGSSIHVQFLMKRFLFYDFKIIVILHLQNSMHLNESLLKYPHIVQQCIVVKLKKKKTHFKILQMKMLNVHPASYSTIFYSDTPKNIQSIRLLKSPSINTAVH